MVRIFLFLISVIILTSLISACSISEQIEPVLIAHSPANELTSVEHPLRTNKKASVTRIRLALVGDIMLGTDYPRDVLADDDGESLLTEVNPYLQDADITFGNLEGVLLDGGEPRKVCNDPDNCYLFRTPTRYVQYLSKAGFDVMSLANNHARDFGEQGRSYSMQTLARAGIRHSGREGDIASWEVKGKKVALIAFAPFIGSHDFLDIELAKQQVQALSQSYDIVIVSMHAGAEGLDAMRLPFAKEFYHGEDRGDSVQFARAVIDSGADLVVGHGPHVPRALEYYKRRLIAYSLGNFCTFWGISVNEAKGLAPILKVELDDRGRFLGGQIISAIQVRPNGPVPDPQHNAAKLIAELTQADFPDSGLSISREGQIQLINSEEATTAESSSKNLASRANKLDSESESPLLD